MARSSKDGKVVQAPIPEGGEMTVTLRGKPDEVREHLGVAPEEGAPQGPASPAGNGMTPEKEAYLQALKDPRNAVVVKRISPRNWEDKKANVEVFRELCPLDAAGIEEEIRENHGGRKYRSAVVNSETNQVIAADTFDIDADPIFKQDPHDAELERMIMEAQAPPQADVTEESLARQARLTAKQIEYEQLRQQLESLKGQQSGGKPDPRLDARIRELESRVISAEADRKISDAEARHREEIAELKKLIAAQQSQRPAGEDPLIRLMMEQNRQASERFEKLLQQMNDNRMAEIQRQIAELKNRPQAEGSSLKEAVITVKELMGIMGHEDDEEEGSDDPDKPFLERLAERYLPKVFDMIEAEQEKTGKELSKDEIVARINAAADQAVKEEVAKRTQGKVRQETATAPALPAPAPPVVTPTGSAPAAPPPAPEPVQRQIPSIEDEIKIRVASVMGVLERELILRPRGWQWTLAAWQALPEEMREKLSAPGLAPAAAISIFDGTVNQQGLDLVKKKLTDDPKAAIWFERGLAELRGWAAELEKNPDFDPAEGDGEEGEDE